MAELRDRLTKPFPELQDACLTVDQLDTILSTPLTLHLPANDVEPQVLFDHPYLIPRHQLAGTVFSQISGLLTSILFPRSVFISSDQNEDCFHAVWDTIIRETLAVLAGGPSLEFQRNSTDVHVSGTIAPRSRPDFLCWMDQALVLRGEEKRNGNMLSIAYDELRTKFGKWSPLFYGELPFVFAYATGGCIIQYACPFSLSLHPLMPPLMH